MNHIKMAIGSLVIGALVLSGYTAKVKADGNYGNGEIMFINMDTGNKIASCQKRNDVEYRFNVGDRIQLVDENLNKLCRYHVENVMFMVREYNHSSDDLPCWTTKGIPYRMLVYLSVND